MKVYYAQRIFFLCLERENDEGAMPASHEVNVRCNTTANVGRFHRPRTAALQAIFTDVEKAED